MIKKLIVLGIIASSASIFCMNNAPRKQRPPLRNITHENRASSENGLTAEFTPRCRLFALDENIQYENKNACKVSSGDTYNIAMTNNSENIENQKTLTTPADKDSTMIYSSDGRYLLLWKSESINPLSKIVEIYDTENMHRVFTYTGNFSRILDMSLTQHQNQGPYHLAIAGIDLATNMPKRIDCIASFAVSLDDNLSAIVITQ